MQRIVRYATASDFLGDIHDYLAAREAANSLILGLAIRLVGDPHAYGPTPPYFAAVFDDADPVLAALMTPPYYLQLSCEGKEGIEGLELLARDLRSIGLDVPGANGPRDRIGWFAKVWDRLAGVTHRPGISLRLYELRAVTPARGVGGCLRPAGEADTELVVAWTNAFHHEAVPREPPPASDVTVRRVASGDVFIWDDDGPVSMAIKTRPTQHGISIGGVYTPPESRRRGYASACVAALSQQLLDAGFDYCTLFTDLSNSTSNAIYQQIGYVHIGDFQEIIFLTELSHAPTSS